MIEDMQDKKHKLVMAIKWIEESVKIDMDVRTAEKIAKEAYIAAAKNMDGGESSS
jgi:hypothetical protein